MAQHEKTKGVWIVVTGEGAIIPENSEINALRTALSTGGKHDFVQYGNAFGQSTPNVGNHAPEPVAKPKAEMPVDSGNTESVAPDDSY